MIILFSEENLLWFFGPQVLISSMDGWIEGQGSLTEQRKGVGHILPRGLSLDWVVLLSELSNEVCTIPLTIHVRKFNRILRMTWMYHSSNPSFVLPLGYSLTVLLRSLYSLVDEIGSSCCVGWEKVEQSAIKFKGRGHTFNCPSGSYTSIYSIGLRLFIL